MRKTGRNIKLNYVVAEDNAGCLYLFILSTHGNIKHAYGNFEYYKGDLQECLDMLDKYGKDAIPDFENDILEMHDKSIEDLFPNKWDIDIVEENNIIYPENMGGNALYEYDIERE